ncbi:MAG: PIN domain-containing protein [Treponema sp.]|jgi:predicted nucleic acid-binding protein|nr:PIN domain-containing protein [Treponema sp.]
MNGLIDDKAVLDSCTCMNVLNKKLSALPKMECFISVVTRMELYAKPDLTAAESTQIDQLLSGITVIPLDDTIERTATAVRRFGKPRPNLPDAIVAATAVVLDAPLITQDDAMLKLQFPGVRSRLP